MLTLDVGFLDEELEEQCVLIYVIIDYDPFDDYLLDWTCEHFEAPEFSPGWRHFVLNLNDLQDGDGIAFRIEAEGLVGIDNAGAQRIPVPDWYLQYDFEEPTIGSGGPEGAYLSIPPGVAVFLANSIEFPEGATSFTYWIRVAESGDQNEIRVDGTDLDELSDTISTLSNDPAPANTWVRRTMYITPEPPYWLETEDEFTHLSVYLANSFESEGALDIAFSTSDDIDSDEDGIYDIWEEEGVISGWGNLIDLPAMGADPDKPDIFVQLDYMCRAEDEQEQEGDCDAEHPYQIESAKLSSDAIETVVEAFYDSPYVSSTSSVGINLWVDQGPNSVLDYRSDPPTTWGDLSAAGPITYDAVLGSGDYDWGEFDEYKMPRFIEKGRLPIFHYAIAGDRFGSSGNDKSGKSRGIDASDFIITLGSFEPKFGTENDQAGVFMHELGHNLGLHHGGDSGENYKPNYPSVMNYSYFLTGIIKNGAFGTYDYSRVDPDLDEEHLDESEGIPDAPYGYGASYYCGSTRKNKADWTAPIDWNCDNDTSDTGAFNVNKNEGAILLSGFTDWDFINFWGGAIGADGDSHEGEYEEVEELGFEEAVRKGLINLAGRPGIEKYMDEKGIPIPQDDPNQRVGR